MSEHPNKKHDWMDVLGWVGLQGERTVGPMTFQFGPSLRLGRTNQQLWIHGLFWWAQIFIYHVHLYQYTNEYDILYIAAEFYMDKHASSVTPSNSATLVYSWNILVEPFMPQLWKQKGWPGLVVHHPQVCNGFTLYCPKKRQFAALCFSLL